MKGVIPFRGLLWIVAIVFFCALLWFGMGVRVRTPASVKERFKTGLYIQFLVIQVEAYYRANGAFPADLDTALYSPSATRTEVLGGLSYYLISDN